jgi:uridylate kinase
MTNPRNQAPVEAFCELCEMPLKQCQHSMEGPAFVFVSGGGTCFHATAQCPALSEGQRIADGMGLREHEINDVAMAQAIEMGRERCSACFPQSPRK